MMTTAADNNFREGRVRLPHEFSQDIGADGRGYFKSTPNFLRNSIEAIRFRKHGGVTGKARATLVRKKAWMILTNAAHADSRCDSMSRAWGRRRFRA